MTKRAKKTVWITRTQPSAGESGRAFQAAGYDTITAPLLTLEHIKILKPVPKNAVLIFTSQNGVRAFCDSETSRNYPVVTVGDATAALARELGFLNVSSAAGTSDDIAPLIARAPDKDARYLHISGNHVRGTVSKDLDAMGLLAERRIYYRSAPVQALPNITLKDADIAAIFSPLAAQTLTGLCPDMAHISAVSISETADAALGSLAFKSRHIARAPTLESMIAACAEAG